MADFFDLLHMAAIAPDSLKQVMDDKKKIDSFKISSNQLDILKQLNTNQIKSIVEAIEDRLSSGAVASTNACPGTNACCGSRELSREVLSQQFSLEDVSRARK